MNVVKEPSKSERIRQLAGQGKTKSEIAKELGISYQFAYNVIEGDRISKENYEKANKAKALKTVGTAMYPRMNYHVSRGLKELYAIRDLTVPQWEVIKAFFNQECAFCGRDKIELIADHLIPAIHDGDFTLGNVVASCQSCNDKRGKKAWEQWLTDQFPAEHYGDRPKERIAKIKLYLSKYPYEASTGPVGRLTTDELQTYNALTVLWEMLLSKANTLRSDIGKRRVEELGLAAVSLQPDPDEAELPIS